MEYTIIENHLAAGYSIMLDVAGQTLIDMVSGASGFGFNTTQYDTNTLFNVGSVTKPFAASLVMKLCENHGVLLTASVRRFCGTLFWIKSALNMTTIILTKSIRLVKNGIAARET